MSKKPTSKVRVNEDTFNAGVEKAWAYIQA